MALTIHAKLAEVIGVGDLPRCADRYNGSFPGTLYMFRQFLNVDRDDFNKFVVCPRCCKIYDLNDCVKRINNREIAKVCSRVRQHRRKTVPCGASLVYKVQLSNGKSIFFIQSNIIALTV